MNHQRIATNTAPAAIGPYSQAVFAGDTLYISGQIAIVPDTGALIAGGVAAEACQALANLGEILKAAGLGYGNVVKTTVFLTDMADFSAVNEVYARVFSADPLPARAAVAVKALPKGALVEVEAIAVR